MSIKLAFPLKIEGLRTLDSEACNDNGLNDLMKQRIFEKPLVTRVA